MNCMFIFIKIICDWKIIILENNTQIIRVKLGIIANIPLEQSNLKKEMCYFRSLFQR